MQENRLTCCRAEGLGMRCGAVAGRRGWKERWTGGGYSSQCLRGILVVARAERKAMRM